MYDNIAAWMISGGRRSEAKDERVNHLVAINEARAAAQCDEPGLLDRVRSRFGIASATPTADCCGA